MKLTYNITSLWDFKAVKQSASIKKRFVYGLLILILSVASVYGYAFIVGPVKVSGVVVKYNKKTVILKSLGQKVAVPRSSIPKKFKLRTGKKVYALLKVEPLQSQMRKEAKQMRKQAKNKSKNKRAKRRTAGAR